MWKIALTITAALLAKAAFAFDVSNLQPSSLQISMTNNCANKPSALAFLKEWRQRARQGYADKVSKYIPSLTPGANCIKSNDAHGAKYQANGDYFLVHCLAETKGTFSHIFKMEVLVEPDPSCLGDARINDFMKSKDCLSKGDIDNFVNNVMKPCPIVKVPPLGAPLGPKLRNGNVVVPADIQVYNDLLQQDPEKLGKIMDKDRRVKVGPAGSGSGSEDGGGSNCNAGGCFPGSTNSRDVK